MSKPDLYLSERGYVLKKNAISESIVNKIRNDLTVTPKSNDFVSIQPKSFQIFTENKSKLYIPRFYGLKEFGEPEENFLISLGDDVDLNFKGDLREHQKPIVENMMNVLNTKGGGILNLFTGQGKTVLAIKIMSILKKKTLIIVHKEFLLNQWLERLNEFMPGIRIGFIRQKQIDVENFDVVIGMLQSISMKEYPPDTFKSFGFSIVDEAHHISSEVFSRALPKISTKYMMGLSATLDRKDGLRFVFEWFLGEAVQSQVESQELGDVYVNIIKFTDPKYQQKLTNMNGKMNLPKMINRLTESPNRLNIVLNILKECVSHDRKILLLSERRANLQHIGELCKDNELEYGFYYGGMKQKDLKESETKQILLGTYNMISEGFDLKALDTLVFVSPKSDVVQSSGRILRQGKNRPTIPLIIDIVDQTDYYKRVSSKRNSYYKKTGFTITKKTLTDTLIHITELKNN
tara:strand:+ start:971 stop:2356 length:1386 start_codon:yes stop_codon:yes gene_type:complete